MRRTFAVTVAAAVIVGGAAIGASADDTSPAARAAQAAPKAITFERVGQVHVGDRHADLLDKGLVGPLRPGCELGGPNTRSAKLRSPLRGSVDLSLNNQRKVRNITVRGGAEARGVGIGDKISDIKAKFPKAIVDHGTEEVFGLTLVRVPKNGGGKISFAVPLDTKRISLIGVPFIAFCE
jgi:hypothetical protein